MDRDTFILTVYWVVEDEFKKLRAIARVRHAGFTPAWSDAEVITMELCGEYWQQQTEKDLVGYFAPHYRHCFPTLSARTLFVRQAANLWQFQAAFHRRLTFLRGQAADPIPPMDTMPRPVCPDTRAHRDWCLPGQGDYGYGDAQDVHAYGCKRGWRMSRCGMRLHAPLREASPHDLNHVDRLGAGVRGSAPAAKGFITLPLQQQLAQERGVSVVTPRKKHMQTSLQRRWSRPAPAGASWWRLGARICPHALRWIGFGCTTGGIVSIA